MRTSDSGGVRPSAKRVRGDRHVRFNESEVTSIMEVGLSELATLCEAIGIENNTGIAHQGMRFLQQHAPATLDSLVQEAEDYLKDNTEEPLSARLQVTKKILTKQLDEYAQAQTALLLIPDFEAVLAQAMSLPQEDVAKYIDGFYETQPDILLALSDLALTCPATPLERCERALASRVHGGKQEVSLVQLRDDIQESTHKERALDTLMVDLLALPVQTYGSAMRHIEPQQIKVFLNQYALEELTGLAATLHAPEGKTSNAQKQLENMAIELTLNQALSRFMTPPEGNLMEILIEREKSGSLSPDLFICAGQFLAQKQYIEPPTGPLHDFANYLRQHEAASSAQSTEHEMENNPMQAYIVKVQKAFKSHPMLGKESYQEAIAQNVVMDDEMREGKRAYSVGSVLGMLEAISKQEKLPSKYPDFLELMWRCNTAANTFSLSEMQAARSTDELFADGQKLGNLLMDGLLHDHKNVMLVTPALIQDKSIEISKSVEAAGLSSALVNAIAPDASGDNKLSRNPTVARQLF